MLEDVAAWRTRPLEARLPDRLLRRADGQGPRGPLGAAPRLLPGDRRHRRRRPRGARDLVAGDRGRQVLAGRPQRPAPPRRRGRPDRLRRRPDGLPRGDRGRLPAGLGADLHRAPDPRSLRYVTYRDRKKVAADLRPDLHRRQRRRRRSTSSSASTTQWGAALPDDRRVLARRAGSTSSRSSRCPPTCAAPSTPPTASRPSTARSARRSRPAGTSPTNRPPPS